MKASPPLSLYKKIATVFIVLTVALVVAIFYYSLTYAFVTITPKVSKIDLPFSFLVTEDKAGVDVQKGVFEGLLISQELSGEKTVQATGSAVVKSEATGTVKIVSTYSKNQPLIKTTRLLTVNNELFRISENVVVPANGSIDVSVYQDDPTLPVNIAEGQKMTIPGLNKDLQTLVYALANGDFGGKEQIVTVLTKEDIEKGTQDLIDELGDKVKSTVPTGSTLVLKPEISEKSVSAAAGDKVSTVTIKIKLTMTGIVMKRDDAETYAKNVLVNSLSVDSEISNLDSIQISYVVDRVDADKQVAQVSGAVSAETLVRKDSNILSKKKLLKLSGSEATTYLEHLPEVEKANISFFPFWVKRIPSFEDHVIVEVKP